MIKVIIADDERIIREGLKNTVDWKYFNCQIVGDARNGLEGVEKARELNPDLIIADIKMPILDGLEMAEKIQEFNKECKFIIITGYGEFEYAKKAIKLNAVDFIQKPIDDEELIKALEKAVMKIIDGRRTKKLTLERLFLDMMRGNIMSKDIAEKGLDLNQVEIVDCLIVLLQIDELKSINQVNLEGELIKYISTFKYLIQCHENIFAVLIEPIERGELIKELKSFMAICNSICKRKITIGVSNKGNIHDLRKIYDESKKALKNKLYTGEGSINFYDEIKKSHEITWDNIIKMEMDFRLMLKTLNEFQIKSVLDDIYRYMYDSHVDLESVRQATIDLIHIVNSFKRKNGIEVFQVYKEYEKIRQEDTIEGMKAFMLKFSLDAIEEVSQINIKNLDDGLSKIVEYINNHYTEELSLKMFARELYLSEGYLSKRLKDIFGMSYSEYITFLRIEKAVELLKSGEYKVVDVAKMVGYSDYRYFSKVFKKQLGILPSEI